jgi:hypothetical protein
MDLSRTWTTLRASSASIAAHVLDDVRTRRVEPRSVVLSALVVGGLFVVIEVVGRALDPTETVWVVPRRVSWLLLREDVQPTSTTTQPSLIVLALTIHAMLSTIYSMLIGLATRSLRAAPAILLGALIGLGVYLVSYHALTPVFPVFAGARGLTAITSHVAFGAGAAAMFRAVRPRLSRHSLPFAEAGEAA